MIKAIKLGALAAAAALTGLSTALAGTVTLDFEGVAAPITQVFFDPGEVMFQEGGFTVTASGGVGGSIVDVSLDNSTGSDSALLQASGCCEDTVGLTVEADDGSAFDLSTFDAAGLDGDGRFRIDFERQDGTTGSTDIFLLSSGGTFVPVQTLMAGLTDIVRATFFALGDSTGGNTFILLDNIVVEGVMDGDAVPLPAAALLFPLGLGGLAAARRRRR